MKKKADTTTDMNHEQALVDYVVTPNAGNKEDPWDALRALNEPTPQSKPSDNPWEAVKMLSDTSGRGSDSIPRGVPTDEAPPVNQPEFSQVPPQEAGKEIDRPTPEDKALESITPDVNVKSFQELFASMGKWQEEADGRMSPKLADLGREIERQIANKIDNQSVIGMIVSQDGSKFNTTVADVNDALKLVEQHQKSEKGAKYTMDDRLVSFAQIMYGKR